MNHKRNLTPSSNMAAIFSAVVSDCNKNVDCRDLLFHFHLSSTKSSSSSSSNIVFYATTYRWAVLFTHSSERGRRYVRNIQGSSPERKDRRSMPASIKPQILRCDASFGHTPAKHKRGHDPQCDSHTDYTSIYIPCSACCAAHR